MSISIEEVRLAECQIEILKHYSEALKSIINKLISDRGSISKRYDTTKALYEPKLVTVDVDALDFKTSVYYKRIRNKLIKRKNLLEQYILKF